MSHVHESCHTYMSHITRTWVMSHVHESCHVSNPNDITRVTPIVTQKSMSMIHHVCVNQCRWCTAYYMRSVIFPFTNLYRWFSSLGLFYRVPLVRDQGDWDWRLRLNDTPNAIGCTTEINVDESCLLWVMRKSMSMIYHVNQCRWLMSGLKESCHV